MRLDNKLVLQTGLLTGLLLGAVACSDDPAGPKVITVSPGTAIVQGSITGNRTFAPETTYVLKGFVKVESGSVLTILPGTKIVGDTTVAGSSLYVLRGGKLMAEGTAEKPIVFTSQRAVGTRKPGDWGGIVIVGRARINRSIPTQLTEGPESAAQNYAGGTNDDDSSGSLKYVRVEFAGYDVSGGKGQELNSLSLYAVGRGTKLQYVQVHAGLDDGFEWFGGTVDGQYLVSSETGDDHFDWTEGYRGRNQFVLAYQSGRLTPAAGAGSLGSDPRGFEGDGCEVGPGCDADYRANQPLSQPVFANFTLVGARTAGYPSGGNANGLLIRRGSAGSFYNGIVARFNGPAVSIRDSTTNNLRAEGLLTIRNVALVENASNFELAGSNFGQESNFSGAGLLQPTGAATGYFSSLVSGSPVFVPTAAANFLASSIAVPAALYANYSYGLQTANYLGAVAPTGPNWMTGWTSFALD